jgi:cellulose synthase/poly-beta-1,6-N-acetylglucosamine synthase-like glycosyltransferase
MTTYQLCLAVVFWIFLALILYTYAGYPALIWLLARRFGRPIVPPAEDSTDLPTVSLLISAYNEQDVIAGRITNALAMDYPPDKLKVVVACDGCSDHTPHIVLQHVDRGVRLLNYHERRGKAAVLNSAIAELPSDIILLSDANTSIDPTAARNLIRWFRDPEIGAVCGRLLLIDPHTGQNVDGSYWKYETFLKRCESRLGALLGANGAIYAIRKSRYVPIPEGTIVDDFCIPLLAKLKHGCRIIYDPQATAREDSAPNIAAEFHRRSRIGAGGFQCLRPLCRLLDPRQGWIAFTFLSHKVLRWFCPFFLLGLLLSNALLVTLPFYRHALLAQIIAVAVAYVASFVSWPIPLLKPLRLLAMFTSMNAALLIGFYGWLRGTQTGVWKRTARSGQAQPVPKPLQAQAS